MNDDVMRRWSDYGLWCDEEEVGLWIMPYEEMEHDDGMRW